MHLSWAVYPASCVRMRCLQAVAAWPTTSVALSALLPQQPRLYHHMTLTQFHNRGCCRCSSQDHPWRPSSAGAAAGQAGAAACSAAAAGRSDSGAGPYLRWPAARRCESAFSWPRWSTWAGRTRCASPAWQCAASSGAASQPCACQQPYRTATARSQCPPAHWCCHFWSWR